jgi:aldehyde dehydrogenase (NAD+)
MQRIRAGTVWISYYGCSRDHILSTGGHKTSGLGKDVGREAHQANSRSKSVLIDIPGEAA